MWLLLPSNTITQNSIPHCGTWVNHTFVGLYFKTAVCTCVGFGLRQLDLKIPLVRTGGERGPTT